MFPEYKLRVDKEKLSEARSLAVNVINEISGCGVAMAATLLSSKLPQVLNFPLYKHQALILQQELKIRGYDATPLV
ncbi:MAG: hypothetical protein HC908_03450 [Calothrix sp. SM1_7_51]|nr:hypothetical protein [Calothrix sp. SM1_7_51]